MIMAIVVIIYSYGDDCGSDNNVGDDDGSGSGDDDVDDDEDAVITLMTESSLLNLSTS